MRTPRYRHHAASNLGFVEWQKKRHYFTGPHDSAESLSQYRQFLKQYVHPLAGETDTSGHVAPRPAVVSKVSDLLLPYLEEVHERYGTARNGETACQEGLIRLLDEKFGTFALREFNAPQAEKLREAMIAKDWSRQYINRQMQRLGRIWRWGAKLGYVEVAVYERIRMIEPLRKPSGSLRKPKLVARESPPVHGVRPDVVEKTLPELNPQVAAMVQLQWLTGCRPQDACNFRWCDVDRSKDVWLYTPHTHKREWAGETRTIVIGPKAQAVLQGFASRPADQWTFSPQDAVAWLRDKNFQGAKFKNRKPKAVEPQRVAGDHYTTAVYRAAIQRAAVRAGAEKWSPNQLRHRRGTDIRKQYGLEAAQVVLGHVQADTTQIYAERDLELAIKIARELG